MIVHGYSGFTVILILVYSIFSPDRHAPGGEQILLVVPTTEYLQFWVWRLCPDICPKYQRSSEHLVFVLPCAAKLEPVFRWKFMRRQN